MFILDYPSFKGWVIIMIIIIFTLLASDGSFSGKFRLEWHVVPAGALLNSAV